MANTTNFGWETPDDTDLVKDGAAAIRTLGQAIDTSLADLEGGTTGQILSKNSNTDMDFVWITNDVGDITAVTAGTGLSGGGNTGAVTLSIDTATTVDLSTAQTLTNKTLTSPVLTTPSLSTIDAKGDLIVGSADNTIARLAVGTNGDVLTADSTATNGIKWAASASGGMTLLSTTTLSGSSTSVSITPTGYNFLAISIEGIDLSAGGDGVSISINNSGNTVMAVVSQEGTSSATGRINNTFINYNFGTDMDGSSNNAGWLNIYNPNSTTNWKPVDYRVGWTNNAGTFCSYTGGGAFKDNTAVSSIMFDQFSTSTFSAGTVKVYGVK